jgi:uncharacterized protein with HEPN domain
MQPEKDVTRLYHIWEAATEAMTHIKGRTRTDLDRERLLQLALVRLLEIIGEAAANISMAGRRQFPGIPWGSIVGMRNKMIHAYFNVNLDIVWNTAVDELPILVRELEPYLVAEGLLSSRD